MGGAEPRRYRCIMLTNTPPFLVLLASLAACTVDDPRLDAPLLDVPWSQCSLISGSRDGRAQCAGIEVPLHWSDPEGERITLFLKRYEGAEGGGQVWALPGGPGQSGSDLEPLVDQLITMDPDRSYYMIDHRGVGRSTRLRCPSSEGETSPNGVGLGEGEIADCLDEVLVDWTVDQLAGFSTANAAHDVGQLIDHLRVGEEEVTLWGGSYGTHWLERYLSLYPEQPSAAVFSAVALDVDLLSVDRHVDEVTRRWLDACDADPSCGPRFVDTFGQDARTVVTGTFGGAGKELCPEIAALDLDIPTFKPFFGQIFGDIQGRSLYTPIVYRVARCEPRDVAAMARLAQAFTPPEGTAELPLTVRNWGFVLGENIAVSELTRQRSASEVQQDYDDAISVQGNSPRLAESKELWPAYEAEPFEGSDFAGPVLMLHGEYDFLPESAYRRIVDHYVARGADFIEMPGAPHSLESPTTDGGQCGISLIVSRLLDPTAPLDDCAQRVQSLRFEPPSSTSFTIFGTDDPWDGTPSEG